MNKNMIRRGAAALAIMTLIPAFGAAFAQNIEESYAEVIGRYTAAMQNNDEEADFEGMASSVMRYYHIYGNFDFYSAEYDLNNDGTPELIIGTKPADYDAYDIVDLYTHDGEKAVRVVDNDTFGDRSQMHLYTDGTIEEIASGGADDTGCYYYKIEQGGKIVESNPTNANELTDLPWEKI